MARSITINGMGLVGSILARRLESEGYEFQWWDPQCTTGQDQETPCAWKASTGCVYPSGNLVDRDNYGKFEDSARRLGMEYEMAEYCFSQKSIPHKENSKDLRVLKETNGLKFVNQPSYHVNVQRFVQETRGRYADRFTESPEPDALRVEAHGFHGARETDYRWGWHAKARVLTPENRRICFNLKEGRFVNAYLYPVPGTDEYYLGTHFLYQKKLKNIEMKDKHLKMFEHIKNKMNGYAEVIPNWDTLAVGWRPAFKESKEPVIVEDGTVFLKPQMANGLRHHPNFLEDVMAVIRSVS